jgi:hypothetical protein
VVSITPRPLFTPGERTPGTHCTGGWVGPRAGLDREARGKILCPCRGSNPDRPVVQPVVRHYTDWANPAPTKCLNKITKPRVWSGHGPYTDCRATDDDGNEQWQYVDTNFRDRNDASCIQYRTLKSWRRFLSETYIKIFFDVASITDGSLLHGYKIYLETQILAVIGFGIRRVVSNSFRTCNCATPQTSVVNTCCKIRAISCILVSRVLGTNIPLSIDKIDHEWVYSSASLSYDLTVEWYTFCTWVEDTGRLFTVPFVRNFTQTTQEECFISLKTHYVVFLQFLKAPCILYDAIFSFAFKLASGAGTLFFARKLRFLFRHDV